MQLYLEQHYLLNYLSHYHQRKLDIDIIQIKVKGLCTPLPLEMLSNHEKQLNLNDVVLQKGKITKKMIKTTNWKFKMTKTIILY